MLGDYGVMNRFVTARWNSIFQFWDALADFDAASIIEARDFFLKELCAMLDAQNASWVGAVLMDNPQSSDPLGGWRPRAVHRLLTSGPKTRTILNKKKKALEQGQPDIVTIRRVALAGTFRVHRLVDIAPEGWFESRYYKTFYLADRVRDTMWAGIPVNTDTEVYVGLFRSLDHAPFSAEEADTFAFALQGLKWFHRRQLLGEGIGVALEPLTATERAVLEQLLSGQSEPAIARDRDQSVHTTHDHVKRIYKKYGVTSRSALMALWLGFSP